MIEKGNIMKYKKLILPIIVIVLILLVPTIWFKVVNKNLPVKVEAFTIPSLEEYSANLKMLEKSKAELGDVVKPSKVNITKVSYRDNDVTIKGTLVVNNIEKPFLIKGTVKNCGEENKNRIILAGEDTNKNFDVLDCSFYYTNEWLMPFNPEVLNSPNNSVYTLYLLDKENKTITFCEIVATGDFLKKGTELINNQNSLETAERSNISWLVKLKEAIEN